MHLAATFSAVKFKTYAGQNIFTASGCDRPCESYGQNDEIKKFLRHLIVYGDNRTNTFSKDP